MKARIASLLVITPILLSAPGVAHAQSVPNVVIADSLAGAGTFVPSYIGAILVGAMSSEHAATTWGFNPCPSVTIVPLAGPFMAAAIADRGTRAGLFIDGVAQVTGATLLVSGIVWPKLDLSRKVMPLPIFSRDMTGFALTGKF